MLPLNPVDFFPPTGPGHGAAHASTQYDEGRTNPHDVFRCNSDECRQSIAKRGHMSPRHAPGASDNYHHVMDLKSDKRDTRTPTPERLCSNCHGRGYVVDWFYQTHINASFKKCPCVARQSRTR